MQWIQTLIQFFPLTFLFVACLNFNVILQDLVRTYLDSVDVSGIFVIFPSEGTTLLTICKCMTIDTRFARLRSSSSSPAFSWVRSSNVVLMRWGKRTCGDARQQGPDDESIAGGDRAHGCHVHVQHRKAPPPREWKTCISLCRLVLALEGLSTYFEFMALPKETCQGRVPNKQQVALVVLHLHSISHKPLLKMGHASSSTGDIYPGSSYYAPCTFTNTLVRGCTLPPCRSVRPLPWRSHYNSTDTAVEQGHAGNLL